MAWGIVPPPPCSPPTATRPPPLHPSATIIYRNGCGAVSSSRGSNASSSSLSSSLLPRIATRRRRKEMGEMWCVAKHEMGSAEGEAAFAGERMLVFVPPHPLIKHWISVLRNEDTPSAIFRSAMGELGRLLMYEAAREWLPTISTEIRSPMGITAVEFIDGREPIMVIPILRAGLALVEHASSIFPATKTYHLGKKRYLVVGTSSLLKRHAECLWAGLRRDEETLQPSIYLNNLPDKFPVGCRVLVVDPMLATGGTMVVAIDLLKDRGVENRQIKIISAVAAPPALQKLSKKFPGVQVYTGIIDPVVNEKGFIVPGLGDAGDRSFGT